MGVLFSRPVLSTCRAQPNSRQRLGAQPWVRWTCNNIHAAYVCDSRGSTLGAWCRVPYKLWHRIKISPRQEKHKHSDARRRWSPRPSAGAGMLHACKLRAGDHLAVRFARIRARGARFTFILLSAHTSSASACFPDRV